MQQAFLSGHPLWPQCKLWVASLTQEKGGTAKNGVAIAGAGLTHGVGRFSALPVPAPFQVLGPSISERRAKTTPGQKVAADAQPGAGDSVEAILFGTKDTAEDHWWFRTFLLLAVRSGLWSPQPVKSGSPRQPRGRVSTGSFLSVFHM